LIKLKNDILLKTIRGEKIEQTPVWLMRQAGRILPQYRLLRDRVEGFKELVETPELACEVTLQPVDELGVDAAIIFSDILVVPQAMGLPYQVFKEKGPIFERTIRTAGDIEDLIIADPEQHLAYVTDAIKLTKQELNGSIPLIGFAGAPWTIMAYMVEGGGSKTFSKAKVFLYEQPRLAHQLLEKITASTINYLKAQIKVGADIVQLFDTWAGILAPEYYNIFGSFYLEKICNAVSEAPIIVFAKGAHHALPQFAQYNCNVIGLDWTANIQEARVIMEGKKSLQGNLDPTILLTNKEVIQRETNKMLQTFEQGRYIANLGHGVYPNTPLDNVKYFIETVKNYESKD